MKMSEMAAGSEGTEKCLEDIGTWLIVLLVIANSETWQYLS